MNKRSAYHGFAGPVKVPVVEVSPSLKELPEHAAQLLIVGSLEEVEAAHVAQVGCQLLGVALAQRLDGRGTFGVADLLVALLQGLRLQSLPGQRAAQEVHEHVTQGFQVVTPGLLCKQTETVKKRFNLFTVKKVMMIHFLSKLFFPLEVNVTDSLAVNIMRADVDYDGYCKAEGNVG